MAAAKLQVTVPALAEEAVPAPEIVNALSRAVDRAALRVPELIVLLTTDLVTAETSVTSTSVKARDPEATRFAPLRSEPRSSTRAAVSVASAVTTGASFVPVMVTTTSWVALAEPSLAVIV